MKHTCHALGCKTPCPPRMLMCRACWSKVPRELQAEVYATVKKRKPDVDASWAPWWRAQAKAIAHVAFPLPSRRSERDAYLLREMKFADELEHRGVSSCV